MRSAKDEAMRYLSFPAKAGGKKLKKRLVKIFIVQ